MFTSSFQNKISSLYGSKWKLYGPYPCKDGRKRVVLYDGKRRMTRQYAKLKMEAKLGRKLKSNETVDHRDEDKSNDAISNLQVLSRAKNVSKASKAIHGKRAVFKCLQCNSIVKRSASRIPKSKRVYCSSKCASKHIGFRGNQYTKIGPLVKR